MRNEGLNGWRQIDVQLKRRHDLIPNLVNAVRGSMEFERDTLTAVMEARAKALTATSPLHAAVEEDQLTQAPGPLLPEAQADPTLQPHATPPLLPDGLSPAATQVGHPRP